MPKPRLYVLRGQHPRALSAGRGTRGAAIAVSRGLVAVLTPAELEGVLAHELAKIHNRDVTVQTPLVVLAAMVVETSRIGGWLERALLVVPRPDRRGVPPPDAVARSASSPPTESPPGFCGSPHGLADALLRLEQTEELFEFASSPGDRAAVHDQPVRRSRASPRSS